MSKPIARFGKAAGFWLKPQARHYVPREEQIEANAYWAGKEYKKWVVLFSYGPAKQRTYYECFVGGSSSEGAIRCAQGVVQMMNFPWAKRRAGSITARLATYKDLGAQREKGVVGLSIGSMTPVQ